MAGESPLQQLKAWLDKQEPGKREKIVKYGLMGAGMGVLTILYYASGQDDKKPPPPPEEVSTLQLGEARLQDDIRATYQKQNLEEKSRNDLQDKELKGAKEENAALQARLGAMENTLSALTSNPGMGLPEQAPATSAPQDPLAWAQTEGGAPQGGSAPAPGGFGGPSGPNAPPPVVEMVGGIGSVKPQGPPTAAGGDVKKKTPKFLLPVGFMPGKLLTGLNAKTVEGARNDPEPMTLRVQAPMTLPNDVRAQLEGCLVIAHGYGSLASERVEARLVSINCLDFEGKSRLGGELKGYITDNDGVKGIYGRPVSKMGTNLARLAWASAIEGAGAAYAQQATTTNISPVGQIQSIDPDQIGKAGIGAGVQEAAEEYKRIMADLVRQQAPVLEVGPAKDVTIVVTEEAWLEVKTLTDGG